MIKKTFIISCVIGLGAAFALSGCGEAQMDSKAENPAGIIPSKSVLLENAFEEGAKRQSELTGSEEFVQRLMSRAASVYSKPEASASILGTLAEGAEIQASSISADGAWIQIVYNGRVAYVPAETVTTAANQPEQPLANFVYNYEMPNYLDYTAAATEPEATEAATDPAGEDPTEPGGEDPTEPGGEDPTKPGGEEPTEPGGEDPTEPGGEEPTEPGGEEPSEPGGEEPSESDAGGDENNLKANVNEEPF